MSRKKFIGLIFMMLLSITGIIWVQIVWIRNAVSIRNENFNNAVVTSLNNAANSIESSQKMSFFNDFILKDPEMFGQTAEDITGYISIGSYSSVDSNNGSFHITSQSVTGTIDNSGNVRISKPSIEKGDSDLFSEADTAVINSSDKQVDPGVKSKGEELNREAGAIYIKRKEFLDWVRKRTSDFHNMSDQMISEVYQWEKTLDLDHNSVGYALQRSFLLWRIETPFEFAIIRDGKVQDGSFNKSEKNDFLKSNYKVTLFPDNIIRQDLQISVIFPERTNYVLGSMGFILGGSLLFSLIILATFGLSLYFIIRQKKISEMKSDFINNMTHEFKTPIATISLAADTITNAKVINDESSIRHFIGMIKKENSRMNKKVETILQIASLDKKEIDFKFENLSMHTVIERAVDTIEIQVQQRNGKIKLNLKAGEPVILGDNEHLTNLVNNLLDNAIKYSPESPDISVETWNSERGFNMSVEDKGVGMTKSVQSKIFERFYRQSSGNVHDVKGFGLGLNYVRAIIDAHRGAVTVSSEPGKGSRFEIFLPFNWEN